MACAHPIIRWDKNFHDFPHWRKNEMYFPCGRCLNCRVDKANELTHRCEQELINFKCGAFVTFTYDNYHIVDKLRHDSSGNLNATLKKTDLKKFMYRLRQNIKRNMPDTLLSNHHFKYLAVGEYGGDGQIFDRPHIHILFFGLDFAVNKRMFERSWQGQGMINVEPILNGGIRYCLKYLDKQLFGKQAEQKYDKNNIERPFQTHSLGLGSSLYKSQLNYIKSHHGCYRWKGKDVPVPNYYKNKFLINKERALNAVISKARYEQFNNIKPKSVYDLHDFNIQQNLLREKNLNKKLELSGRPRLDYDYINNLSHCSKDFIYELACKADLAQVPF